jgi:hypothetical protein
VPKLAHRVREAGNRLLISSSRTSMQIKRGQISAKNALTAIVLRAEARRQSPKNFLLCIISYTTKKEAWSNNPYLLLSCSCNKTNRTVVSAINKFSFVRVSVKKQVEVIVYQHHLKNDFLNIFWFIRNVLNTSYFKWGIVSARNTPPLQEIVTSTT